REYRYQFNDFIIPNLSDCARYLVKLERIIKRRRMPANGKKRVWWVSAGKTCRFLKPFPV
ncbi:MAG: hypothetical protein ACLUUJ_08410, partial [Acutalibacteraceae bacterium]